MSNFTRPTLPTRGSVLLKRLLSLILLAPAAVFLGAWSFQDGEEKVTIKGSDVPLLSVFKTIKKQTGYNFFYAADYVNDKEKVSVDVKNARVEDVLQRVLGRDYVWVYNENAVSITKKKEPIRRSSLASVVGDSSVKQITVSGSVTDAKGAPIPGATVVVKGTKDGASTDADGNFSLPGVASNAVLVISSVGFEKREVAVKGRTLLAKLNVSVNDLDEAVVVAYNTTTQRANTGAVTVVKGEKLENLPNRSFDKSLQGLVPGLQITGGTGQPGGGVSNMILRGISTGTDAFFGSTVRNPLIVIDGIPVSQDYFQITISTTATPITNPLAQLNPSDIETISVLKDAAAIALYGSKASNGVILITTKKGKLGKTIFSFRHQTDMASKLMGKVEVLNQQEYLELLYETYRNTNSTLWTDAAIRNDLLLKFPYQVLQNGDTSFYPSPNWFDALYNDRAFTVTNEVSMSGGNEKSNFYLNFEYSKQNGIVRKTDYDRKSLRFNFENRPSSWLKLGIATTLSYNIQNYANPIEDAISYGLGAVMSPLNPIRLADGNYLMNYEWGTTSPVANPVATAEYNINRNIAYRGLTKIYGEFKLLKNFTFTSNLGIDFMLSELKEKSDPRLRSTSFAGYGSIRERDARRANIITTNTLRFDKYFKKKHSVNVLLGQEAQVITDRMLGGEVRGSSSTLPHYSDINSPGYTVQGLDGSTNKQTLLSLFGQLNYGYVDKYFLSASIRRDGSSRFGDRQQWGTYWSTGIGWVISAEPFMSGTISWLNYLKLRSSIGSAGSSGAVGALTRYDQLSQFSFSGNTAIVPQESPGNPDIQWEQTFTWDAGLEARFLHEKIVITGDIYSRRTNNLIYNVSLPSVTGYINVLDNIGNIKNNGIELAISADVIKSKNFHWNINANWSTNQNKLVKANVNLASILGGLLANEEGRNFNSFYLRLWAGVNPVDGKPQWVDSTGKLTSDYNAAKRQFVGKPQPDGFGSITNTISYNGIELSANVYYQYGFKIYDQSLSFPLLSDGARPYVNQVKESLDRWRKPGDIASNPRRTLNNTDGGNRASTRYLFQGDYVRLQNVMLAYNFPKRILEHIHLSMLKIFLQGHNLALLTKFPGQDPDNASVGGNTAYPYPNQRSFSAGLNVNF